MCLRHLNNDDYYKNLNNEDPSHIIQTEVTSFADKYRGMLTKNEYELSSSGKHNISVHYRNTPMNNALPVHISLFWTKTGGKMAIF